MEVRTALMLFLFHQRQIARHLLPVIQRPVRPFQSCRLTPGI